MVNPLEETLAASGMSQADTVCPDAHIDQAVGLLAGVRARLTLPVRLGGVLGRGGMATVYEGTQPSLARRVAVKVPIGDTDERQIAAMVAEAMVTAHLEHPGIVPVHALEADADGTLRLVIKRIEGRSWASMLDALPGGGCPADRLPEHLRIWLKIGEALSFAHSRGVVHRDVKPENVMVGAFGEVYLLDWGIAAAFSPTAPGHIPRLNRDNAAAGTPAYMAPEQAIGDAPAQGPATDVFLLGATLYRLLSGRPPHGGGAVSAVRAAAAGDRIPPLPDRVDPELARICVRALDRDPAARPGSVSDLTEAVERWLELRPARRVLEEIEQRVAALERSAAGHVPRPLLEAEFQAILASLASLEPPLSAEVLAPVRGRAMVCAARVAIRADDLAGVNRLLALPSTRVEPAVRAELEAARDALRERVARRRLDARRRSPAAGRRARGWAIGLLGAAWVLASLGSALAGEVPALPDAALGNALAGVAVTAVFLAGRRHLGHTVPNRITLLALVVGTFGVAGLDVWGHTQGMAPPSVYVLHLLLFLIGVAFYTVGVDPRCWPAVVGVGVALAAAIRAPEAIMWITAVNNLVACGIVAFVSTGIRGAGAPR